MSLWMQRKIVVAIDETCRIYNEIMPSMEKSEQRLEEVILKTHTKIIRSIKIRKFEKLLAVVDP